MKVQVKIIEREASEMAQRVKTLAAKLDALCLTWNYLTEGENQTWQVIL